MKEESLQTKCKPEITLLNIDCMEYMAELPDKAFDLAIVDPPYGINADKKNNGKNGDCHERTSLARQNNYKTGWDDAVPGDDYFKELRRVSKHQIIWGANFFGLIGGYIYWDKMVSMPTYSDGELAFCSILNSVKTFRYQWHGMLQGDMKNKEARIHPTQKPIKLYDWLLHNYAKPGQRILDTHLGSGSSAIAAYRFGVDFVGCEIDTDYYNAANNRFKLETAQISMFDCADITGINYSMFDLA